MARDRDPVQPYIDVAGHEVTRQNAGVVHRLGGIQRDDARAQIAAGLDRFDDQLEGFLAELAEAEEVIGHRHVGRRDRIGQRDGGLLARIGHHPLGQARVRLAADRDAVGLAELHGHGLVEHQAGRIAAAVHDHRLDPPRGQARLDHVMGEQHKVAAGADQVLDVGREGEGLAPKARGGDVIAAVGPDLVRVGDAGQVQALEFGGVGGVEAVVEDQPLVLAPVPVAVDEAHPPGVGQVRVGDGPREAEGVARSEVLDRHLAGAVHHHAPLAVRARRAGAPGCGHVGERCADRAGEVAHHVELAARGGAGLMPVLERAQVEARVRQRPGVGGPLQHLPEDRGRVAGGALDPGLAATIPVRQDRLDDRVQRVDHTAQLARRLDPERGLGERVREGYRVLVGKGAERGPGDLIEDPRRARVSRGAPQAHVVLVARHVPAQALPDRRGGLGGRRDGAGRVPRALAGDRVLDLDRDRAWRLAALGVEFDQAPQEADIDRERVGAGLAGAQRPAVDLLEHDGERLLEHVVGEDRERLIGVEALPGLDCHALEAADRGLADLERGHLERAVAPADQGVEELVVADDLGEELGAQRRHHAVPAQDPGHHAEGQLAVARAGDEQRRRVPALVAGEPGQLGPGRRRDGVDQQHADNPDGGADQMPDRQAAEDHRA